MGERGHLQGLSFSVCEFFSKELIQDLNAKILALPCSACIIYDSQDVETNEMSILIDEYEVNVLYTYKGILFSPEKKKPADILTKWLKPETFC